MIFSQSSRPIRLIKIVLPVFVLLISTLACSFSSNNNNTSHEATAAALNQTAVALSVQATQLAEQQNQNNPAKPVEQQPTKPAPPAQPPQVAAPTQPPPADVQNDSNNFYIINDSDFTICYFYLSLSSNSDWGVDQLEDNLGALDVVLSQQDVEELDRVSDTGPHYPNWLQAGTLKARTPQSS